MNGWSAFWLLCAVFVVAEVVITLHGIDTLLWQFKTPAEKEIQQRLSNTAAQPEASTTGAKK